MKATMLRTMKRLRAVYAARVFLVICFVLILTWATPWVVLVKGKGVVASWSNSEGIYGPGEEQESGPDSGRPRLRLVLSCLVEERDGAFLPCESERGRELARQPHAVLRFTLRATNDGSARARNIVAVAPLIAGFELDPTSVRGADAVEYSLDGKSFSPQPKIEVNQSAQPAPVRLYRFIRFRWREIPAKSALEGHWIVRLP